MGEGGLYAVSSIWSPRLRCTGLSPTLPPPHPNPHFDQGHLGMLVFASGNHPWRHCLHPFRRHGRHSWSDAHGRSLGNSIYLSDLEWKATLSPLSSPRAGPGAASGSRLPARTRRLVSGCCPAQVGRTCGPRALSANAWAPHRTPCAWKRHV